MLDPVTGQYDSLYVFQDECCQKFVFISFHACLETQRQKTTNSSVRHIIKKYFAIFCMQKDKNTAVDSLWRKRMKTRGLPIDISTKNYHYQVPKGVFGVKTQSTSIENNILTFYLVTRTR